MKEPILITALASLEPYVADRVIAVLKDLRDACFDPIVFEARRTQERQNWLYGIGRTHSLSLKPVTWTRSSRHLVGKAVDIISKSRLWSWPAFYSALARAAVRHGLTTISKEQCHIEWRG